MEEGDPPLLSLCKNVSLGSRLWHWCHSGGGWRQWRHRRLPSGTRVLTRSIWFRTFACWAKSQTVTSLHRFSLLLFSRLLLVNAIQIV